MRFSRKQKPERDRENQRKSLEDELLTVEALLLAVSRRGEVLSVIEAAADVDDAREKLQALLGVGWIGATAVLDLQFRRLSAREREKIMQRRDELIRERQNLPSEGA
jgi:DNA gyrase/topoisomerase IV subunit A